MKKISALFSLIAWGYLAMSQGMEPQWQRSVTDPEKGIMLEYNTPGDHQDIFSAREMEAPLAPEINWMAADAAAIDNLAKVSSVTQQTMAAWGLNDQRISLYGNSNSPVWEVMCPITAWDEWMDMTDDGSRIVNGYNNLVEVYEPASSAPIWSVTVGGLAVRGVQIQNDGLKVFVAAVNQATQDSSFLFAYTVGEAHPDWSASYAGNFTSFVISKNGNRVLLGEYGSGINKLFVLDAADGTFISEVPYATQYPPAVSYDGGYIVSGDYSGNAYLYEYNESLSTYTERWNYRVNGTSSWVCGMGISADGSTLAVGTLIFTTSGGYDGELYVFNNYSPDPLWIFPNMGDMVLAIDLSEDGSVIAAAGWGPMGNNRPDLYLFRKQSNVPYLVVDSPGSFFCVDLSPDGKLCAAGGKAVHAREFGMGGRLYNINADLGGGTLGGSLVKEGSPQQAGSLVEVIGLDTYFTFTDEDSYYELAFIPAGTYTVRYSAVGYFPQPVLVEIAEGQVTMQDVTLFPAGPPPENLFASQGAGYSVDLSWDPPYWGGQGYNIYRKRYAFDFYPSTPLATVGGGELNYSDPTALPLTHYYYAVTAQLGGSLETTYSNDAIGWISTGFITDEISAYVGSSPAIDGVISPGEWADAFQADLSNVLGRYDNIIRPIGSVMGYFKVNNEKSLLYVAVENFNDATLEDHDEVALYVDDNNDGSYPPPGDNTEGNYWAVYYSSGNLIRYRPIYSNGGVSTTILLEDPQIEASVASGHLVYEFAIPLGQDSTWQINYNENDQSGIFVFVLDDPADFNGWWPAVNMNIFTAGGYGMITFGATDEVPPAPENLEIFTEGGHPDVMLEWNPSAINDFDHYNIYWSTDGGGSYDLLDFTIGVQYFHVVPSNGVYYFYITVIDQAGQESGPSNIVFADIFIGIDEQVISNDISMIKMGPNPFARQLNIDVRIEHETLLDIRVYDIGGKPVAGIFHSEVGPGLHQFTWNGRGASGNELAPGLYLVRFDTGNGNIKTFKLVMPDIRK